MAEETPYDRKGGSAFPWMESGVGGETCQGDPGMTLRDWFAGQALSGLLAHASGEDPHKAPKFAYVLADAMLEAGKDTTND